MGGVFHGRRTRSMAQTLSFNKCHGAWTRELAGNREDRETRRPMAWAVSMTAAGSVAREPSEKAKRRHTHQFFT